MRQARHILLILLAVVIASCGRSPFWPQCSYDPPTFGLRDSIFSDEQVRAAVYSTYRCPPGFYAEPPYPITPYYLNTISILPSDLRNGIAWLELASEDPQQVRAWAESSIVNGNHMAPLAEGPPLVTQRYIEFSPAPSSGNVGVPMRAHRPSYMEPAVFSPWWWNTDSLAGTFNARPIDSTSVRGLSEYLWFKWIYKTAGCRALSSFGYEQEDAFVHVIHTVETVYGDYNMSDDLHLSRLEFRVSKGSGQIIFRRALLRHVIGQHH